MEHCDDSDMYNHTDVMADRSPVSVAPAIHPVEEDSPFPDDEDMSWNDINEIDNTDEIIGPVVSSGSPTYSGSTKTDVFYRNGQNLDRCFVANSARRVQPSLFNPFLMVILYSLAFRQNFVKVKPIVVLLMEVK